MKLKKNDKEINKKEIKKRAVALKYDDGMVSPQVVAKGSGHVAEKILEKAEEANVTIYEDKALVEELDKIDLGLNIPPYLYEAIAQVLLFVGELDRKYQYKSYSKNGK